MNQVPDIQKLLLKFVKNDCTSQEIATIIKYVKQTKGTDNLPNFNEVMQLFEEIPDIEPKRAQTMYQNILKTAKHEKRRSSTRRIWRYAAAAVVVGIMASTYFFRDRVLNNDIIAPSATIVRHNIHPGTDKATLTLETGETISLEKNTSIQTQNATSNGEQIIYNNSTSRELVYNHLTIPRGGQFQLSLADGTRVWLNSETQLKYPVSFTDGESRQVELMYGEAYFEVSHSSKHKGAKFKLLHNQQEIEVLGTEFNVKAYKHESNIYTTLVEGKVAVNYQNKTQNLVPGQQSNVNVFTNTLTVSTVNLKTEVSWKDGIFSFKEKSLKEIMASLSRWYDVDVVFENKSLEKVQFNGVLRKHQNIEDILSVIMSSSFDNYEIIDKTIILK
ncbi:FecR family protein [Gelidibacter sp. F63206]|uniref:FecR family protein n=1 Tax=Gelidibacter sp. F63206 TaxID=2926425 RepID=UPI001FF6CCF5|nr:FecR family protein [Gelidibacter sp. F63206]MCK0115238.1 FecR family protein [Gelidibacter sp. F63206]